MASDSSRACAAVDNTFGPYAGADCKYIRRVPHERVADRVLGHRSRRVRFHFPLRRCYFIAPASSFACLHYPLQNRSSVAGETKGFEVFAITCEVGK